MQNISRLLSPKSIAIIGGRNEAKYVQENCAKVGFNGALWHVHPKRGEFSSLTQLPSAPDAAFVCVNRQATIGVVSDLRQMGAGGAVAYAAGFQEAEAELEDAAALGAQLLEAAADMPMLGPNCYGFVNYLDGAALWPDQQGGRRTDRGVAILTQSSNIAINITMQRRGLPLAYVLTAGNQAQLRLSDLAAQLVQDKRVTALGLHIEGVGDIAAFEAMAMAARAANVPIVAVKVGRSAAAQAATISHTASLAGSAAGASALLERLGIAEVTSIEALLETLKLLHATGPLPSRKVASLSCSGGEAGLMADALEAKGLEAPDLTPSQKSDLGTVLGPKVALANPLDYHTYIWNDAPAIAATYTAMMKGDADFGMIVADFPRGDRCFQGDWEPVITGAVAAKSETRKPVAILSTLPENLPEDVSDRLMEQGITPLGGFSAGLDAVQAAVWLGETTRSSDPVWPPCQTQDTQTMTEAEGKAALATFGVETPQAQILSRAALKTTDLPFPCVLKVQGVAHKTEAGGVALNLTSRQEVLAAADRMTGDAFLVEEMIEGALVELLLGVTRDPAHGYLLTLGAGGTLTEVLRDTAHLLLPASRDDILAALSKLRVFPLLTGFRGAPKANIDAIVDAVCALQDYVGAHRDRLDEVEINPLIVTPTRAIAADVLIQIVPNQEDPHDD